MYNMFIIIEITFILNTYNCPFLNFLILVYDNIYLIIKTNKWQSDLVLPKNRFSFIYSIFYSNFIILSIFTTQPFAEK